MFLTLFVAHKEGVCSYLPNVQCTSSTANLLLVEYTMNLQPAFGAYDHHRIQVIDSYLLQLDCAQKYYF